MAALTFDRTPFAALGGQYTRIGLGNNLKIAGEPIGIRVAHASLIPGALIPALGIIVNRTNPLQSLTMAQVTRIFAVGGPSADIVTWGQAGLKGRWANLEIRPVGPPGSDYTDSEDPQVGEFIGTDKLAGLNFTHTYTAFANYKEIVQHIAEDPAAIGIAALNLPLGEVKVIPLKTDDNASPCAGSAENIGAGRYPFDRYIYIYLRVGRGLPVAPFAKEYLRMVLSDEGQHAIAQQAAGYIPLNQEELAEERAKLERQ